MGGQAQADDLLFGRRERAMSAACASASKPCGRLNETAALYGLRFD